MSNVVSIRKPLTPEQKARKQELARGRRAAKPGYHYFERYKLSASAVAAILETQNGKCAICRCGPPRQGFDLDHDHSSNRVRGFLCRKCNLAIGLMADNIDRLIAAAAYLRRNR